MPHIVILFLSSHQVRGRIKQHRAELELKQVWPVWPRIKPFSPPLSRLVLWQAGWPAHWDHCQHSRLSVQGQFSHSLPMLLIYLIILLMPSAYLHCSKSTWDYTQTVKGQSSGGWLSHCLAFVPSSDPVVNILIKGSHILRSTQILGNYIVAGSK